MNCFDQYLNTYFTQLFTTLGSISGVVFSSAFAIPMFSYYVKRIQTSFKTELEKVHNKIDQLEKTLDNKKVEKVETVETESETDSDTE